jgi:hypothetical protein
MEEINHTIYRYKFDELFLKDLVAFSKIHQFDERKTFKEEWNLWCDTNEELIQREERRLFALGYKGDCKDKMFKSARYYFRKKSAEKKEPKKRRCYIGLSKLLLDTIDAHIQTLNIKKIKPSDGFDAFLGENDSLIQDEIERLKETLIKEEIHQKIKKTYKNRCFINKDSSFKNN